MKRSIIEWLDAGEDAGLLGLVGFLAVLALFIAVTEWHVDVWGIPSWVIVPGFVVGLVLVVVGCIIGSRR